VANRITIALIENSYLLASGMENLLKELHEVQLLEVFDGTEKNLLKKIESLKPDCMIINPDSVADFLNSFIASLNKETAVVGLIHDSTPAYIKSRFAHHINMKSGKHELMNIISQIVGNKNSKKPVSKNQPLTEREITILKQITLGLTNQEIAEKLFLSIHTVMTHRKNMTKKLGIKTVSGLTVYAILNKVIDIQDIEHAS